MVRRISIPLVLALFAVAAIPIATKLLAPPPVDQLESIQQEPSPALAKLQRIEEQALQDAVAKTTDPALAPFGKRDPLRVATETTPGFGWSELDSRYWMGFESKYFPLMTFVETNCTLTGDEWSRATFAIDQKTGKAWQLQWVDIDGMVQDKAVFLALVKKARISLEEDVGVEAFVRWGQSIMDSPRAIFGPCGNSVFGSKATKVEDGWTYVTTVDGAPDLSWKITCDANGIVTDVDRNHAKLPPKPTRMENRAARMAEKQRRVDAAAWWIEEANKADLAMLVANADFIGVGFDFTSASGTSRLYRVFTFDKQGMLFGDRLGNYSDDFYKASVQFPAVIENRFDVASEDRWIVFLTSRLDQGHHRDSVRGFGPAYDPAGEHAVLRCTDELLAKVRTLISTKAANPARDAAIRKSANADSVQNANARTNVLIARYAANRVAEWSVEPLATKQDADKTRARFLDIAFSLLASTGVSLSREMLEADPAFEPLKDHPRWKELVQTF